MYSQSHSHAVNTFFSRSRLCILAAAVAGSALLVISPGHAKAQSPETAAAAEVAKVLANEVVDRLPRLLPVVKRSWERRKDKKRSVIESFNIEPLNKNMAFADVGVKCGFYTNSKKGRRRVKWIQVFYFDTLIGRLDFDNANAPRSANRRITLTEVISGKDLGAAIEAGRSKLPVTIRVRARCDTYDEKKKRFRKKHSVYPARVLKGNLSLKEVNEEFKARLGS